MQGVIFPLKGWDTLSVISYNIFPWYRERLRMPGGKVFSL